MSYVDKVKFMRKAYITILGRSTWALINTYHAVLMEEAYHPDVIHIFAEDTSMQKSWRKQQKASRFSAKNSESLQR